MPSRGIWKDGKQVVIYGPDYQFPDRCIKTNEETSAAISKISMPHDSAQQAVELGVRLSPEWEKKSGSRRGKYCLIASLITLFIGMGLLVNPDSQIGAVPMVIGFVGSLFVSPVLMYFDSHRVLRVSKADDGFLWIKGAHPSFLNELPLWSAAEKDLAFEKSRGGLVSQNFRSERGVKTKDSGSWTGPAIVSIFCFVGTILSVAQLESARGEMVRVWKPFAILYNLFGYAGAVGIPFLVGIICACVAVVRLSSR